MKERRQPPKNTPSRFDRALAAIAPGVALKRMRARLAIDAASGYEAARSDRARLRNFFAASQTADGDALPDLAVQRARSRALMMNAPLAAGAIHTNVTNVIGTGLRLSARADRATLQAVAGITPEQAAEFEARAEAEWRLFCRTEHCDITGGTDFDGLQELAYRSVLVNGDCFALVVKSRGGPFDFSLQLIEADRVCNPNRQPDSETFAGGVELDQAGAPLRYHVARFNRLTGVPHDWTRFNARAADGSPRVIHLIHRQRIGLTRGVPYLAPVMAALHSIERYTEAEITAAVLNACIAIIGESPTGDVTTADTTSGTSQGLHRADITYEPRHDDRRLHAWRKHQGLCRRSAQHGV